MSKNRVARKEWKLIIEPGARLGYPPVEVSIDEKTYRRLKRHHPSIDLVARSLYVQLLTTTAQSAAKRR